MGDSQIVSREMDRDKIGWLIGFIRCLRLRQWTKNLLVFASLLFSRHFLYPEKVLLSIEAFLLFCIVSGCVYIGNDFIDFEKDRQHPEKKNRPIAAGVINPYVALLLGTVLLLTSLLIAFWINGLFGGLLLSYFLINVAYSMRLKHVVIIDIMIIAAGFVIRAVAGGIIIGVGVTSWFLLCTMLLALFLAISKRRHELLLFQHNSNRQRKVLKFYSIQLLDQFITIVATATIMCYSLFTFTSKYQLMWTIPFVIYGIFRYLYLTYMEQQGGSPEKILLADRAMRITIILYVISVIISMQYL